VKNAMPLDRFDIGRPTFDARRKHGDFEHRSAADRQAGLQHSLEPGAELFEREVGEESESAEVDAHDGDGSALEPPRRGEQCSVAAEHENAIGLKIRPIAGAFFIDANNFDALLEPWQQRFQRRPHVRFIDIGNDKQTHAILALLLGVAVARLLPPLPVLRGRVGVGVILQKSGRPKDGRGVDGTEPVLLRAASFRT
jgi:hypothetical protein